MSDSDTYNLKEIAGSMKGRSPPYQCPACLKHYRSMTGIMYHLGQFGPTTKVPRCLSGDSFGTPQGSPAPSPASPGTAKLKRKTPRREMTWAEAQRMVEVDFETCYRRIEIERELDVEVMSEEEEEEKKVGKGSSRGGKGKSKGGGRGGGGPRTPQKGGKGFTPRGKAKNKGKRKSKLKGASKDNPDGCMVPLPKADSSVIENLDYADAPERKASYFRFVEQSPEELDETVEYDMDEEDYQWLSLINEERKSLGLTAVPQGAFEVLMDRLEKECFFESRLPGDGVDSSNMYNIDENAECCICNDGECHNTNAILFCDMCNLAVHQECYGVPYIPEGQWLCRRCLQSPSRTVDCALCPSKGGAFKQTVDGRWSHVICALWIPEVQFANTVFLEPIDGIKEIPAARWKLTCYVCHRRMGACIQCAKPNCYVAFHVTCAQQAGFYMKIEVLKGEEIKKVAYCDGHTPPSVKRKRARMALAKGKEESEEQKGEAEKEEEEGEGEGEEGGEGKGKKGDVKGKESQDSGSENGQGEEENEEEDGEGVGKAGEGAGKGSKLAKRVLDERKSSTQPVVNIPFVPQHRLDRIISRVSLHKKSQFIPKLVSFWKLKRQSRNGVPLLRRLQASNHGQRTAAANLTEEEREVLSEQLSLWKSLRQDLERARLLVELVRKREKLKREQLRLLQQSSELRLCPLNVIMKRILDRLAKKDPSDIFAEAVSVEEVPDYLDVIKEPMDFGTMRKKVEACEYTSLDDFEKDFYCVWHNATIYNQKETIYYRAAARIRDAGCRILEQARQQVDTAGVDTETGMHNPDVQEPPPLTPSSLLDLDQRIEAIEREEEARESKKRFRPRICSTASTLDEQIQFLEEKLELIQAQGSARKKTLRRELNNIRRQLKKASLPLNSADADEFAASPRRPAQPITRNAEELACHVLHGSLRLTPSRQQILSHSGIRLEERVSALQEEEATPPSADAPLGEVTNSGEVTEEDQPQREAVVEADRGSDRREKRSRKQPPMRSVTISRSESYIAKIKKKARKIKYKKIAEANGELPGRSRPQRVTVRRKRFGSTGSVSETDYPVNGKTSTRLVSPVRTRGESSSSVSENFGESYSSEERERPHQVPFSDTSVYRRRLASSSLSDNPIPSASSVEDLTARSANPSNLPNERQGRKRKQSSSSAEGGTKRKQLMPESKKRKRINGMVNGGEFEFRPLDLVWAKCRGYPPYPALVIDPDIPSKGLNINGERIQAPSDEVMELRDKNPGSPFLVRFFDGRRTWQWLPKEKLESLGVNSEFDQAKIMSSGPSKRSVQQAYQRARQYQRRVSRKSQSSNETEDDDIDDDDSST